ARTARRTMNSCSRPPVRFRGGGWAPRAGRRRPAGSATVPPSIPREDGMAGPLEGIRIVEIAGIGPGPFCGMMLADLGAEVLRVDRAEAARLPRRPGPNLDFLARGRRSVAVDLKNPDGVEVVLRLVEK